MSDKVKVGITKKQAIKLYSIISAVAGAGYETYDDEDKVAIESLIIQLARFFYGKQ